MTLFFVRFHQISPDETFTAGLTVERFHLKVSISVLTVVTLVLELPTTEFASAGTLLGPHAVRRGQVSLQRRIPAEHL